MAKKTRESATPIEAEAQPVVPSADESAPIPDAEPVIVEPAKVEEIPALVSEPIEPTKPEVPSAPPEPPLPDVATTVAPDKRRYWVNMGTTQIGYGQAVYPVVRTPAGPYRGYIDLPKGENWYQYMVDSGQLIKA